MTAFDVRLDPSGLAVNRTELQLNEGAIVVDEAGIDWGDAAIQDFLADATVGSVPVGRRWPNRTIKLPLIVRAPGDSAAFTAAKLSILQKAGQIQREGRGWLQRKAGSYADVVGATLTFPDRYGERLGWENGVVLQLECLPDFFGDEVTLDTLSSSGGIVAAKLQASSADAVIAGAQDARCTITVADTSGHDQNGVWWGVRSQYFDSASTAKSFYEAEALTLINGSSAHTHSGMSGGTTVMNSSLPAGDWTSVLVSDLASGAQLTHAGTYRVIARAYSATAAPSLRLQWGVGAAAKFVTNPSVALPGSGSAYEIDLGVAHLYPARVGDHAWRAQVQALATVASDPIEIDRLVLVPVAESAGAVNEEPGPAVGAITQGPLAATAAASSGTGAAWTVSAGAAEVSLSDDTSQLLKLTGYGFDLPSDAVILGITAQVGGFSVAGVVDDTIRLLKSSAAVGDNKASAARWQAVHFGIYGAATDLWGTTWAASDVNSAGFGLEVAIKATGTGELSLILDSCVLRVAYVVGDAFGAVPARALYADQSIEISSDGASNTFDGMIFNEAIVDGDLPRIPASGLEERPCELVVVTSEGNLITTSPDDPTQASPAFDAFTVQVKYRPCTLFAS